MKADAKEQIFGYDVTGDTLTVNEEEATVVKYVFSKQEEYSKNPPEVLVQEVMNAFTSRGEQITAEEAVEKVSRDRILQLIDREVKEKWPDAYRRMGEKAAHNHMIHADQMASSSAPHRASLEIDSIIDREEWEKVQAKMSETTGGQSQGMRFN